MKPASTAQDRRPRRATREQPAASSLFLDGAAAAAVRVRPIIYAEYESLRLVPDHGKLQGLPKFISDKNLEAPGFATQHHAGRQQDHPPSFSMHTYLFQKNSLITYSI
ncbi:unnamed protein product [Urochloa humidicola]